MALGVPLKGIRQLPLAVLTSWSWAFSTHRTVDYTSVALPVAVRSVIVRVGVGCTRTRLEKRGSRFVRNASFWVVTNRAGTLILADVASIEEF